MTDEQILMTAREVGWNTEHKASNDYIVRLAKAIAAHEREACAKVCEALQDWPEDATPYDCAAAIRSRT